MAIWSEMYELWYNVIFHQKQFHFLSDLALVVY